MTRGWWFAISLIVGVGTAAALYLGLPEAREWLPGLISVTARRSADAAPFMIGLVLSAGLVLSLVLFMLPAAVRDAMQTQDTLNAITALLDQDPGKRKKLTRSLFLGYFVGSTLLEQPAEEFSSTLLYASKAAKPPANAAVRGSRRAAASTFGAEAQVDQALFVWLYRGFAYWNAGLAVILALVALLQGQSTTGPNFTPAMLTLTTGMTASLLLLGLSGLTSRLRALQVDRLCAAIDKLLDYDPWHDGLEQIRQISKSVNSEVASAVSKSLIKPIDALSGKQGENVKKLTEAVLRSVGEELQAPLKAQATEMLNSLKVVSGLVSGIEQQFEGTIVSLAGQLADHEKALSTGFSSAVKSLSDIGQQQALALGQEIDGFSGNIEKSVAAQIEAVGQLIENSIDPLTKETAATRKKADKQYAEAATRLSGMSKTIETLITEISPSLSRIAEGQDAFLETIEKEATAAQIIEQSSADLSAAAQASRDTVRQFVALAESLTEIGRALQKTVAQTGQDGPTRATPVVSGEELSEAIHKLRKMTEERALPKL